MDFNIPLEIKDKSAFPQLKKNDRLVVAYAVLFGVGNQDAFMRFHPEYIDASGKQMNPAGKKASSQFWNYGKVKDYREAYESELAEFLGRKSAPKSEIIEVDGDRRDKALKSLLSQAMSLVEGGADLDADSLKVVTDIFSKLGFIKGEEEREIKPLRFIPERCFSGCRYRLFVENAVKGGDLIDECKFCRALRYATENGYRDDASNRLDIPKEILEAEPDNTVSTLDILSGKVEN